MRSRRGMAVVTGIALLAVLGMRGRLRRYEIAESSMEPQLRSGDYILAQHRTDPPQLGEIVIFEHPEKPGYELVKRIVGLPGQTIVISDGQFRVDGVVLAESWADGPTQPDGEWGLSPQQVFVLGDNRRWSAADSRALGPVPLAGPRWIVIGRYWPPSRAGRITA